MNISREIYAWMHDVTIANVNKYITNNNNEKCKNIYSFHC